MGIDYDAAHGYGLEIDREEAKVLFDLSVEDIEGLDEGLFGMDELCNEDYFVQEAGSSYSGNIDYWFTLRDNEIVGLEGRCIGMHIFLKKHGIDREPDWFGEVLIW